mgnify:CR=1 FL=1
MIDITAELFKGELGSIYEMMNHYSLKELAEFRDIRIDRKKKEEAARRDQEEKDRRKREAREAAERARANRRMRH